MAFPPLGNSDHVAVAVSIDFQSSSHRDDWDGLCDHLRDVPRKNIFKLGASAAAARSYE